MAKRDPYPLQWPEGVARTPAHKRERSKFRQASVGRGIQEVLDELRRFGAARVVLTSNLRLRLDGIPYSQQAEPEDPGVAAHFQWRGRPYAVACDHYRRCWENLRALAKTIEAMRAIERHGSLQLLERAVSGFSALPPGSSEPAQAPERDWWDVLELPPIQDVTYGEIASDETHPLRENVLLMAKAMYQNKVKTAHPDRGGSAELTTELNVAWTRAKEALGG